MPFIDLSPITSSPGAVTSGSTPTVSTGDDASSARDDSQVNPKPEELSASLPPKAEDVSSVSSAEPEMKPVVEEAVNVAQEDSVLQKSEVVDAVDKLKDLGVREISGPAFVEDPALESLVQEDAPAMVDLEAKLAEANSVISQVEAKQEAITTAPSPALPPIAQIPMEENLPSPLLSAEENKLPSIGELPVDDEKSSSDVEIVSTSDLAGKTYTLDELLRQGVEMRASDIHLNVGYRAMARVDGNLVAMQSRILESQAIEDMVKEIIKDRHSLDLLQANDVDLAYELKDISVRFRVNIARERGNFVVVFRIIPSKIRTIEELSLPPTIKQFAYLERGLVLVTGATGSGKSTTIAAILSEINNTQHKHIVTIEDPIEYTHPRKIALVSQRAIDQDTMSWKDSLRSVLRQDSDVVLIGEMRDLETISATMTVAETGHLVFASLHTNTAAQSVDRIIDVFPEHQQNQIRTQLASVLTAIVSQKLVPINGGGRKPAIELLIATPALRAAIREGKIHQIDNMIQTGADVGMVSMEASLAEMVKKGMVSVEVAQVYANKPDDLFNMLR